MSSSSNRPTTGPADRGPQPASQGLPRHTNFTCTPELISSISKLVATQLTADPDFLGRMKELLLSNNREHSDRQRDTARSLDLLKSHPLFRRFHYEWQWYAGPVLKISPYPNRHYSWIADVKPHFEEAWQALRAKFSFLVEDHRLGVEKLCKDFMRCCNQQRKSCPDGSRSKRGHAEDEDVIEVSRHANAEYEMYNGADQSDEAEPEQHRARARRRRISSSDDHSSHPRRDYEHEEPASSSRNLERDQEHPSERTAHKVTARSGHRSGWGEERTAVRVSPRPLDDEMTAPPRCSGESTSVDAAHRRRYGSNY